MKDEMMNCNLWGKNVSFLVDYGCYFDKHIQPNQKESYNNFFKKFLTSDDVLDGDEIEKAKVEIIKYLKDEYDKIVKSNSLMDFIVPTKISIIDNPKEHQVFLKFENVFDDEHGLAIEFINNKFKRVGDLDIALL